MSDKKPLITIGIPTYNREVDFERAIISAVNQTYLNIEIIVSDNCSEFRYAQKIINSLNDKRIRFIQQKINTGAISNMKYLVEMAKGAYFMWLSDDDFIDTDYIDKCFDFLQDNLDYVLVSGCERSIDTDGTVCKYFKGATYYHNSGINRIYSYLNQEMAPGIFFGLYKIEVLERAIQHWIKDTIALDWFHIANILYIGKGKQLTNVYLNKSNSGISQNIESLVKYYKLNFFTVKFFFWTNIAFNVSRNISLTDKPFFSRLYYKFIFWIIIMKNHSLLPRLFRRLVRIVSI